MTSYFELGAKHVDHLLVQRVHSGPVQNENARGAFRLEDDRRLHLNEYNGVVFSAEGTCAYHGLRVNERAQMAAEHGNTCCRCVSSCHSGCNLKEASRQHRQDAETRLEDAGWLRCLNASFSSEPPHARERDSDSQAVMPDVQVGDRISVNGDLGSVKWSGAILGSKGTWLGVEWDDPARGRHSGTKDGVHYFECSSVYRDLLAPYRLNYIIAQRSQCWFLYSQLSRDPDWSLVRRRFPCQVS